MQLSAPCNAHLQRCGLAMLFALSLLTGSAQAANPDGSQLYQDNCEKCHKVDGKLSRPRWQDRVSDADILDALDEGPGKMPSFTDKLNQAEYQALLKRVRELRQP